MINFENRLKKLKDRRQGSRERAIYESMTTDPARIAVASGLDVRSAEAFELLSESAGVKYAIGAMAPVDHKSTQVSIREGERVAGSLVKSLVTHGIRAEYRLQGSVALDVHIRGHSDVDMLVPYVTPLIAEKPEVLPSIYSDVGPPSMVERVKSLRLKSEDILSSTFYAATVDTGGNKSIVIEGGSLQRKVDVVPSCWYDTRDYQSTKQISDRGVFVYHKSDHELLSNYPFKHIARVDGKNESTHGNLKCVIRLMKNVIADMPEYKQRISKRLSSYDIAAIAYHMEGLEGIQSYMRLGLVEHARASLNLLNSSPTMRQLLRVPDDTRLIFDNDEKLEALNILTQEITNLAVSIHQDLAPSSQQYNPSLLTGKVVL